MCLYKKNICITIYLCDRSQRIISLNLFVCIIFILTKPFFFFMYLTINFHKNYELRFFSNNIFSIFFYTNYFKDL